MTWYLDFTYNYYMSENILEYADDTDLMNEFLMYFSAVWQPRNGVENADEEEMQKLFPVAFIDFMKERKTLGGESL